MLPPPHPPPPDFPLVAQPSLRKDYYSFTHGSVHFVVLNSEDGPYRPASPMLTWLRSDLAAATSNPAIMFLVAMFHHPPYTKVVCPLRSLRWMCSAVAFKGRYARRSYGLQPCVASVGYVVYSSGLHVRRAFGQVDYFDSDQVTSQPEAFEVRRALLPILEV
jgi:hypothetical protein